MEIKDPAEKRTSLKTYYKGAGLVLAAFFLVYMIGRQFGSKVTDIDKVLRLTAEELNKSCPQLHDPSTRLDNTLAIDGKKFQYNYTLTNLLRDSIDVEMLYVSFEPAMINNAKKNPGLELFRNNGVTFVYSFKDMKGTFLTRIEIGPEKYRN